jgi:hypothetical protein
MRDRKLNVFRASALLLDTFEQLLKRAGTDQPPRRDLLQEVQVGVVELRLPGHRSPSCPGPRGGKLTVFFIFRHAYIIGSNCRIFTLTPGKVTDGGQSSLNACG